MCTRDCIPYLNAWLDPPVQCLTELTHTPTLLPRLSECLPPVSAVAGGDGCTSPLLIYGVVFNYGTVSNASPGPAETSAQSLPFLLHAGLALRPDDLFLLLVYTIFQTTVGLVC